MDQIQTLEMQISELQGEIAKLQQRHTENSQNFSPPIGGSTAAELLASVETAAMEATKRRQQMSATSDAIAILNTQLQQKQTQLTDLQKQQRRQELQHQQAKLQPELHALAHEINQVSNQMDAVCAQYREMALAYNKLASELQQQPVCPVSMNVPGIPHVITLTGRGLNLSLGMRSLGSTPTFEQLPQPYRPQPSYPTPLKTRIEILRGSLDELNNFRKSIPDWDWARIAMSEGQIQETERQLQELEQQQEAAV